MKQSMLFTNPPTQYESQFEQQSNTQSYAEYSLQDDVYAQFNSAISNMQRTPNVPEPDTEPQSPSPVHTGTRKRKHTRTQPEVIQTNDNGTMHLPEGFSTVRLNNSDMKDIEAINDNASFRHLSSNMYEDANNTESHYKQTVINNMTKDVLQTAQYLCQLGGTDGRSYENQVGTCTTDTSYGAHQLNLIAARRIIGQGGQ